MKAYLPLNFQLLLAASVLGCAHVPNRERFGEGLEPLTTEERVLVATIEATHRAPAPLTQPAPYCVSFADSAHAGPAPGPELSRLQVSVYLIPVQSCPPTYTSMIALIDSLGRPLRPRPPGYIDPYYLRIWRAVPIAGRLVSVRVDATQGTRGWLLDCEVPLAEPSQATCKTLREWIS